MDLQTLYTEVRALHEKLDQYNNEVSKNATDIAWLKRGLFGIVGSIFTYAGAMIYSKLS